MNTRRVATWVFVWSCVLWQDGNCAHKQLLCVYERSLGGKCLLLPPVTRAPLWLSCIATLK